MNSMAARKKEDRTLAVAAVIYCGVMLAALGVGLYGVFSLFQFMFGSLEQAAQVSIWL
ncbi:MAG TPA: hypothetical protein VF131_06425 [Blastocatellia bacterium]|nr:hypothetical protein [Blastocatellia bacterium]